MLKKGVKLPRKKSFFLANFALISGFFWYWCYHPHRSRDALSPACGIFKNCLRLSLFKNFKWESVTPPSKCRISAKSTFSVNYMKFLYKYMSQFGEDHWIFFIKKNKKKIEKKRKMYTSVKFLNWHFRHNTLEKMILLRNRCINLCQKSISSAKYP